MIILLNLISLNNNIAQFDDRAVRRRRDTTARGGLVKILSWMRHCLTLHALSISRGGCNTQTGTGGIDRPNRNMPAVIFAVHFTPN